MLRYAFVGPTLTAFVRTCQLMGVVMVRLAESQSNPENLFDTFTFVVYHHLRRPDVCIIATLC